MTSGVYQIRNLLDGKVYVGRSVTVEKRWSGHRTALRNGSHRNPHLQAAWLKYGEESFVFELLEEVPPDGLPVREGHYCNALCVFDPRRGYNLDVVDTSGGQTVSVESRRKMSASKKGKPGPWAGKTRVMSAEHKAKILAAAVSRRGQKMILSDAERLRRGAQIAAIVQRDDVRAKLSALQRGQTRAPLTDETKRRISEGKRNGHAIRAALHAAQEGE